MSLEISFNLSTTLPEVTLTCWNWCKEQATIHQSNIDISNMGVLGVAMIALMLYNISVEFQDELVEKLELDRNKLIFAGHTLVFFAFILLSAYLGYYALFN